MMVRFEEYQAAGEARRKQAEAEVERIRATIQSRRGALGVVQAEEAPPTPQAQESDCGDGWPPGWEQQAVAATEGSHHSRDRRAVVCDKGPPHGEAA